MRTAASGAGVAALRCPGRFAGPGNASLRRGSLRSLDGPGSNPVRVGAVPRFGVFASAAPREPDLPRRTNEPEPAPPPSWVAIVPPLAPTSVRFRRSGAGRGEPMKILTLALAAALPLVAAAPALAEGPVERLAAALRFETVSPSDPADFEPEPFLEFHRYLEAAYPATHAALEREVVADYSLLFTWSGRDERAQPFLLTSHFDVVPVVPGTEERWTHPPYGGVVADGFVWGRGALDDKVGVLGTLEAVEALVKEGFVPERTVYLAFGHDEELGGDAGAAGITELLSSRGVDLWFSLDEGMAILEGTAGIDAPVAMIGVAEKGFLTLELTAKAIGGHSSVPPVGGAIPRLARAIERLDENPLPARASGVADLMFDSLAPHVPGLQGFLLENRQWLGGLVERTMAETPAMNAALRTTTAITMVRGGVKANVLPTDATVTVNLRLVPGDTVEGVIAEVRRIIDDPEIDIEVMTGREASAVSSHTSPAYALIAAAVADISPEILVSPALVVGGTDSKHYGRIADDAYRFTPYRLAEDDLGRVHGTDERVSVEGYAEIMAFYRGILTRAAGAADAP